ncbi:MAG: gliding motility-associated C-terminal domain-containing protein [Cytophagales bacterium]|nr:gliding motility-associated C-terminal domain-containing protein [Cytophagales bacterium]
MNRSSTLATYIVALFSFVFLSFLTSELQAQAVFVSARHETINQREILVTFDRAVASGAPSVAGWTIQVAGTNVPFTNQGNFGPNAILFRFDASAVAGHGGVQPFVKPGEILRISFTGGGGINAFAFQNSQNNFVFACSEMIFFQQGNFTTVDVCSPVVMNFQQFQYKISLRYRNSSAFNLGSIFFALTWGDGAPTQNVNPYVSDLTGTANAGFIDNTGYTGSNPGLVLTSRPTHNYPAANPTDCSFNFSLTPFVNGVASCPGITTTTLFATYDTDNANSGTLAMPPSVVNSNLVCLGNNVNMRFTDATSLNCRAGIEPIVPNDQARHIRIVYGSQNNANNIPDIRVGGTQVTTNNAAGTHLFPANPILAGGPGFAPTGIGGVGTPDFNGVIQLATPVTAATALTHMLQITTTSPANHVLNDQFFVRLEYWDICNPYNPGNPNSPAPVTIENFVQIIGSPNPPTVAPPGPFCENDANGSFNFTATGAGAGTLTYTWYQDAALTTILQGPSTDNTFNPVTEGLPVGTRINKIVTGSQTFTRYVTVTQGSNNCTSQPTTITIRIDDTNTPGTIAHPLGVSPITICTTDDPTSFTNTLSGTGGGPAGTFTYQWQNSTAVGGPYNDIGGATAATFDPTSAQVNAGRFFRRRVRSGQCADVFSNVVEFRIDTPVTGGTIAANQTICETPGDPNNLTNITAPTGGSNTGVYNYQWEESTVSAIGPFNTIAGATSITFNPPAGVTTTTFYRRRVISGVCGASATAYSNIITVTVNQDVVAGSIGNPQTICSGQDPSILTEVTPPSGGNGSTYTFLWQESATGGGVGFAAAAGANTGATYDPPVLTSTRFYRRQVSSGVCPFIFSNEIQVTVNALPSANVSGGGSICSGVPAPDIDFTFTGAGPWDLVYSINGVNQPVVNNTTSPFTIVNPAAGTYAIASVTDSNTPNCVVTAPSPNITGSAVVTVQATPPPTVENFTAQAPVCDDGGATNPPDAILDLAPNVIANYAITYRLRRVSTNTFLPGSINFAGSSTAAGIINLAPTYAQFGGVPADPAGYQVVITAIQNTTTQCAGAVPINGPILIINPRPAAPTGPVPNTACSTDATGAPISVTAPVAGFTIVWSSTAAPTFTAAAGTTGGTRGNTFTPTSVLTATYHAFTQSDVAPTNCRSAASLAVVHTRDLIPAPAAAGPDQPLLCATSTTLAATAVNNGGNGVWSVVGPVGTIVITNPTSPTSTVTGLPRDVDGGAPISTTLRWRANSALGVCAPSTDDVILTVNPRPIVNNLTPILCEDAFGGASTANVNLTTFDATVMGGTPPNTVVQYYPTAPDRIANTNQIVAPITVTNGMVRFVRVRNTVTGCINDGTVTFTVRTLPVVNNQSVQICEDFPPGSNQRTGLNLQTFENAITGGAANRDVEWYTDASLGAGFLIAPGAAIGAEQNYTVSADVTLHAKVIDTTPATPGCFRAATLALDYQARPNNNQISDGIGQVLGATYTVCASSNLVLLQIDPGLNPGSTYTWTVPPASYAGEFELLSGTTGFFIILRFPNPVPGGGTLYPTGVPISVKETLGTALCDGNTINTRIIVEGSPPQPIITGPSSVCSNDNGVVFSVSNPVAGTYSWSLPAGATITSLPVTASSITVQMSTSSGSVTVTHASGTGCTSPAAAPFPVTVVNRPTITSVASRTVCSGTNVAVAHTLTSNVASTTYNWEVINITGSVIGSIFGDLANGVTTINQTLFNTSGVNATVTYRITPIGPAPDNCPGTPQNFTVTVNPQPVIQANQAKTICSGASVAREILLTPANLPGGTLFNWPDPDGAGPASAGINIPMGVAGTSHINDVLVNLTNAPIVVNYVITPTSGAGCVGAAETIVITVNPQPVGHTDNTPIACSGLAIGYNLQANIANTGAGGNNLVAGTTYSWVALANGFVTGESIAPQTGSVITDVVTNITNADQVVQYNVTPTSSAGCVGTPFTVGVTVRPEPRGFNDNTPIICSDATVNYNLATNIGNTGAGGNNLVTGTTYSWIAASNVSVAGESTTAQTGSIITDALNNITNSNQVVTYTVTPTSAQGCAGIPFTVAVTVRPEPRGHNDATPLICSDAAVNYNLEANILNTGLGGNGLISGTTYAWVAAANPDVTGESSGATSTITDVLNNITNVNQIVVYTITPTSSNGCVGDAFTVSVTVRPEPKGFDDTIVVCSDATFNYVLSTNIANTGAGGNNLTAGTTYSWVAASNLSVTGESTTAQAGGTITDVLNNVTNANQVVVYTVTPTSSNGCIGNPFSVSVTVRPEPRGYNDATPLTCSDVALAYDLNTNVANVGLGGNNLVTGTTYSWVAAANATVSGESTVPQAGNIINDVLNNVTNSNQVIVYTVTPTSADACVGNPFTVSVTVRPEPRGFNDSSPIVCSDASVNYSLVSNITNTGAGGNNLAIGTTYSWVATDNVNVTGESLGAQTGSTISDVVNNITISNQVVDYTVTPTSGDGCVGNPFTVSVTIRPEPRGFNDVATICSDAAVAYDLAANIANTGAGGNNLVTGTTYSWIATTNASVSGESLLPQTGATITDVLNNVTNANQVVTYTVTPTSQNGCVGNPFTVAVTVQPEPRGFNDATPFICSDATLNYDLSANIANTGAGGNNLIGGTTYSWIATSNTNVTGESTSAQTGSVINDALNNITNATQVVVYTVTPTSAAGCAGNPFTVSINVRPEPKGFDDSSPIVCSDVAMSYDLVANISNVGLGGNSLVVGTTYSWIAADNTFVTGESTSAQTGSTINNTITNTTNTNQQVVYTVTPTSANGCVGNPFTVTVTVRPEPQGFNDNTPLICSDQAVNYDLSANVANTGAGGNNLTTGTTYSWIAASNASVGGESTTPQVGATITDVLNNVTNTNQVVAYTVTPTSGNGCAGNPFTVSVTVRPEPRGYNDVKTICSDATVSYDLMLNVGNTGLGGNNLIAGTTYSWIAASNANVTGESTAAQAGANITDALNNITNSNQVVVYTITPTSADGCAGNPFTLTVTVRPEPRGFNDITPVACSDVAINYNLVNNIANTGAGGNNLVTGTAYSWIAADNPSVTGETTIIAGTTSTITDIVNNVTNIDQAVVYTITPTSSDGCVGDPFTVSVTVRPEPRGFNDPSPIACSDVAFNYDLAFNIANTGAGGNNLTTGTTYSWVATSNAFVSGEGSGTGAIITDVINNVTNTNQVVVYTVTPTSANGCVGNTFTVSVTVQPEPRGFNDATPVVCSDVAVGYVLNANVANTVSGGNNLVTGTTYSWIATDNPNVSGESLAAQAGGTITDVLNNITNTNQVVVYTVTPTSALGCAGNTFLVTVTVRPEPRGFDDAKSICSDANVNYDIATNIANTGLGGNNLLIGTTYSWIAANNADVAGESNVTPGTSILINDVLNNITNIDQVVVYTVTPTSNNGCAGDPFTVSVTVRPEPRGFADNTPIICSDDAVGYDLNLNIGNVGSGGNNLVAGTTYSWIAASNVNVGGESTAAQSGSIITDVLNNVTNSNQVVSYTVTPTSAQGCVGDPFNVSITVRPEPRGFNDVLPISCSNVSVNYSLPGNLADTGSGGNNLVAGTTYEWLAADNSNVSGETLIVTNTATITDVLVNLTSSNQVVVYTVTPTSVNGCEGNPFTVSVTVRPEPIGLADTDAVCSDEAISYNIQSRNINLLGNSVNSQFIYTVVSSNPGNVSAAGRDRTIASAAPITDTYTNTTSNDVTITYTITPFGVAGNCAGNSFDLVITIQPEPIGPNTTIQRCSDDPVNFDLQDVINTVGTGNGVPSKFRYTVSSNNALAVAPGPNRNTPSPAPIADVYTNTTNADVEITYIVTPVSLANDCEGTPFTFRVTVHPEPVGANVVDPICSTALNYNIQTQNINTLGNAVPSVFTYTVSSSDPVGVPPAADRVVASNAPITDSYTNSTGLDVTVTYTITPISSANNCAGTPFTYAVTISSKPVGADATKVATCSDVLFNFNPQVDITNGVIATFTWTATYQPGLTVGGVAPPASGSGNISGTLTNTSNVVLNATYVVTPTAGTCVGDPFTITVPIEPEPVVSNTLNAIVCSNAPYNTLLNTDGVSIGAATYDVSAVVDAGLTGTPTTGAGLAANALINDAFGNVGAIPLKVTYTITPNGTNGCIGNPKVVELTVNPEPVINPGLDNTVCSREDAGIILSTNGVSVAANSYRLVSVTVPGTITADPLNVPAGTVGNINLIRSDRYTNTTNAPVVVAYEVLGISPSNCEGQPQTINLTIDPQPILTPGTANLCSDVPSGIIVGPAAGSTPITDFELKSIVKAPALVAGGSNAGLGNYTANLPGGQSDFLANDTFTNTTNGPLLVTYTVVPIASGCRGADFTVVFTVNPAPAVEDNLNRTVCSDEVTGILLATEISPLSVAAASYNIVSISAQAGLVRTAGSAVVPRNGVTANDIQADQFRNPTNNPLTVTYGVRAVSGATCLGPVRNVVLTVEPEVIAAPVNNAPVICSNGTTDIDLISPTNPTAGVITFNYTAVSSVGGQMSGFVPALSNLPENYKITDALVNNSDAPATVTYSITAVANGAKNGGGCLSLPPAVQVVVTVEPKPKLVASPLIQTRCEGVATNITLNSATAPSAGTVEFELVNMVATGGVTSVKLPAATAIGDIFTPGSTFADVLDNPTTTVQTVTYTFRPQIAGGLGCVGDNVVVTVSVDPLPTITPSAQADICSGGLVDITLTPDVANTVAFWTVSAPVGIAGASNGAGNLIFQTLFNTTGNPLTVTYTITPRANGCNGPALIIPIVVHPKPVLTLPPPPINVCHGTNINIPLVSNVAGTNFTWTVDDPSDILTPAQETGSGTVINYPITNTTGFQASLIYSITPIGPGPAPANQCTGDPKILIVTVAPQITATLVNADNNLCAGTREFLIFEFVGQAPFSFSYSDGTNTFSETNAGNFKVIPVTPAVTTTYTLGTVTDALGCPFTPVGEAVTLTVGDTDANFSVLGPTSSCGPYTATFQYNEIAGVTYKWQWFDGSADTEFTAVASNPAQTITHTFDNLNPNGSANYRVTLSTTRVGYFAGECFKTQSRTITIFPTIITSVSANRNTICSGEPVQFFNQSFGVTTHRWFYRIQGTTAEIDVRNTPTVNYSIANTSANNPQIYEVVYQPSNGLCPTPEVVTPITVYRDIVAGFDEGTVPPFIGGNATVNFTNTSTPVDATQFRYEWNFGLNATPATANGAGPFSVDYSTPGPRDISLRVVNIAAETASLGCESTFSKTINIQLLPLVAAFEANPLRACFPADIEVTENTSTGDLMEWRVVDSNGRIAATSNAPLPIFRITSPGVYSVFLTTRNSITGQVANTQRDNFEIFDNPVASFDLRPNVVFVPDTEMTTFNFSTGATDYAWDFGDGGTSDDVEPVYKYRVEGVYDVQLVAINDHGAGLLCTDTLTRQVTAKQGGVTKVPNAFTPNPGGPGAGSGGGGGTGGNGSFNDVFLPIVKGAEEFNMQIFDRWGNLIFESNSSNIGWDGYDKNGRILPAGVYVYKLTIRLSDGQRSTQIGDVTMIR